MANTNLPLSSITDSSDKVKTFFDRYFVDQIAYPAEQIDAVVGFFRKRGFDEQAASSTSIAILQQAKLDNVNPFDLLDTLEGLTEVQLSAVVTEVLNYNRQKISTLGYKQFDNADPLEKRNTIV